jgi:hypothetical protein
LLHDRIGICSLIPHLRSSRISGLDDFCGWLLLLFGVDRQRRRLTSSTLSP